ncbi:sugar transferase [Patulibacter sp.]|uniref:sugar transferase n=1 Tax=Patulibacter sp. TaxID=1912859 RepID=UPI0027192A41|nr:sugar transferase [Patulibacter sp.]MDO9407236.1 sugar transferase [Patulibacter sp.]
MTGRSVATVRGVVVPLAAGVLVGLDADPTSGLLAAGLLGAAARRSPADRDTVAALPLARVLLPALIVVLALGLVAAAGALGLGSPVGAVALVGAAALALTAEVLGDVVLRRHPTRVLVIGTPEEADELAATLVAVGPSRFRIIGSTGSLLDLEADLARLRPELVVHTDHLHAQSVRGALAHRMRHGGPHVLSRTRFCEHAFGVVPLDAVDEDWLLRLAEPGRRSAGGAASRAMDIAVSGVLLLLVAPFLLLLAPLIAADGEGRILFRQRRVGLHGRPFTIIKLRTMRGTGSDWSGANDPRVTRIGAILRKTHVDELPQLWNVLRGDMALVGPRPEQVAISDRLGDVLPLFPYRHLVRPGITGWARVRAGYAATTEASAVKLGNDLFYLEHRSPVLDVAILVETVRVALFERQYDVDPPAAHIVLGRPAATPPTAEPAPAQRIDGAFSPRTDGAAAQWAA